MGDGWMGKDGVDDHWVGVLGWISCCNLLMGLFVVLCS